jgi:hypothetical protein
MFFLSRKGGSDVNFDSQLKGTRIKKVNIWRYLDINIDDELKWSTHVNQIYSVLLKYVKLPSCVLEDKYFAFA